MIDIVIDDFWKSLQRIFEALVNIDSANGGSVSPSIGRTTSDFFLLRAFLVYTSKNDELAITVDIQSCDDNVFITSDICLEEGEILAEGPSMDLGKHNNDRVIATNIKTWESLFKKFLLENNEKIKGVWLD